MTIRPATVSDAHPGIRWLRADDPTGVRVLVCEDAGAVLAAALRAPNPLHPSLDFLQFAAPDEAAGVPLLRAMLALSDTGMMMRGLPDTPEYRAAMAAGAEIAEVIPASCIDSDDPDVVAWCEARRAPVVPASEVDADRLTDAWVDFYAATHRHLGVTDDRDVLRQRLAGFVGRLDLRHSFVVERAGRPVAVAAVWDEGGTPMALADVLDDRTSDPAAADARDDVAAVLSAYLTSIRPAVTELDGHASQPHHAAVLASVPHVKAGRLTPMHLLRLLPGAAPDAH